MAAPNPTDAAVEAFKTKLTKANTGDLEKKFRKGFPDATDAQIATLGRQGMILKLLEQKRAELVKLAAPVVPEDPMTQLLHMMLAQQKAAEAERAEKLEKEKAERADGGAGGSSDARFSSDLDPSRDAAHGISGRRDRSSGPGHRRFDPAGGPNSSL